MSDLIIVAYIAACTSILVGLMKILADIHIKRYHRNKKLLKIYKDMEEGFVEIYRRHMPRSKYKWPTTLAARRKLWKELRSMGLETPRSKQR